MKSFATFYKEAKQVGILYHFMSVENILKVLNSGDFRFNARNDAGVSMSRNFKLSGEKSNVDGMFISAISLEKGRSVRLDLDGDKMSENIHVQPIRGWKSNTNISPIPVGDDDDRVKIDWEENEEVVPRYTNMLPYILAVQYIPQAGKSDMEAEMTEELKKIGIPVTKVTQWQPYRK